MRTTLTKKKKQNLARQIQKLKGPPNTPILMLWQQYCSLKSARDELLRKAQTAPKSDLEQLVFEHEELEPILLELDSLAAQIADAKGDWQSEIRIKAKVLLDYVDTADGDAVHRLALSLSKAVLALPAVNPN